MGSLSPQMFPTTKRHAQSLTSKLVSEGSKEQRTEQAPPALHTHTSARLKLIHTLNQYASGTILGTEDTVIKKIDRTPGPYGAYVLVGGESLSEGGRTVNKIRKHMR